MDNLVVNGVVAAPRSFLNSLGLTGRDSLGTTDLVEISAIKRGADKYRDVVGGTKTEVV